MPTSFTSSISGGSISDLADVDFGTEEAKKAAAAAAADATAAQALNDVRQQEKALSLDELCRLTRFSRQEIRGFYRTLKQVKPPPLIIFITNNLNKL